MPEQILDRELTLYVQSRKVVTTFYHPPTPRDGSPAVSPEAALAQEPSWGKDEERSVPTGEEFFLSDDQARCVALTEEVATKRGYHVRVVDVARVGRLERLVAEHLRGVQRFPVLHGPGDTRLEGVDAFSDERLSEIMPAEMTASRAFTYLKVRGGDLERIRRLLLGFPEVRELHLLTGDWDIFVVLEFRGSAPNKRHVFDFITTRLRSIPEVLDTSTVVPEYSITKFPL
jgi:DNA-binding Lrp family transcriptional regulator